MFKIISINVFMCFLSSPFVFLLYSLPHVSCSFHVSLSVCVCVSGPSPLPISQRTYNWSSHQRQPTWYKAPAHPFRPMWLCAMASTLLLSHHLLELPVPPCIFIAKSSCQNWTGTSTATQPLCPPSFISELITTLGQPKQSLCRCFCLSFYCGQL